MRGRPAGDPRAVEGLQLMPRYESLAEYVEVMARRGAIGARIALRVAAEEAAEELTALSKEILQKEVYDIPEKRDPHTGRRLWKRTGDLMREELFTTRDIDVIHRNYSGHMIFRFRYGKPNASPGQFPANAPQQISEWFVDAIRRRAWWRANRQAYWIRQMLEGHLG